MGCGTSSSAHPLGDLPAADAAAAASAASAPPPVGVDVDATAAHAHPLNLSPNAASALRNGPAPSPRSGAASFRAASMPARPSVSMAARTLAGGGGGVFDASDRVTRVVTEHVRGHDGQAAMLRGALLPNFYRTAAVNSVAVGPLDSEGSSGFDTSGAGGGGGADMDDGPTGMGGRGLSMWSGADSDDEDLDDEEQEETINMLHELTLLAVPMAAAAAAANRSTPAASGSGTPVREANMSPTPPSHRTPTVQFTPMRDGQSPASAGAQNQSPSTGAASAPASGAAAATAAAVVAADSTAATATPSAPRSTRIAGARRAALASPGAPASTGASGGLSTPGGGGVGGGGGGAGNMVVSDTLFHGFYAKRCITSVKKSMASSGLYLVYKDMFCSMDPAGTGSITRGDWAALLGKLGLPVESATSLGRIVGLGDSTHISLEQFAMVMALSMHGPYVRLLQRTQSQNRRQVFLGGDKILGAGAAGGANWRKEVAIPIFTREQIPFFNPAGPRTSVTQQQQQQLQQLAPGTSVPSSPLPASPAPEAAPSAVIVGAGDGAEPEWSAELVILEALAKTQAHMMLFVVGPATRSIAAMVEASEHIVSEKEVVLVLADVAAGSTIGGEVLSPAEAKDLNRGRAYLADVAHRNAHGGVAVFREVALACEYVVKRWKGEVVKPALRYFTKPVAALPPLAASAAPSPQMSPQQHSSGGVTVPVPEAGVLGPAASSDGSVAAAGQPGGQMHAQQLHHKSHSSMDGTGGVAGSASAFGLASPGAVMSSMARRHSMGIGVSLMGSHSARSSARRSARGLYFGASPAPLGSLLFNKEAAPAGAGEARKAAAAATTAAAGSAPSTPGDGASNPPSTPGAAQSPGGSGAGPASPSSCDVFNAEEWPLDPRPDDFSRYIRSAHFAECARIVFKHQLLLSRRAAIKVAQQQQQAQAAAGIGLPSSPAAHARGMAVGVGLAVPGASPSAAAAGANTNTLGVAPPPGLFRTPSSPVAGLAGAKLKHSASGNTLPSALIVPAPQHSALTGAGLHIVTGTPTPPPSSSLGGSPLSEGELLHPAAQGLAPLAESPRGDVGASMHHRAQSGSLLNPSFSESISSTTAAGPLHRERERGERERDGSNSGASSVLGHSRVLVRVTSHSSSNHDRGEAGGSPNHSALASPSARRSAASVAGGTGGGMHSSPSSSRPPTSAGLARDHSGSASLHQHQHQSMDASAVGAGAGGMHVNLVSPEGLSQPQTQAQLLAASSAPASPAPAPAAPVPGAEDVSDPVATFHLFTMLIRLQEIVQLSTGIQFGQPYPYLVAAELEAAGEAVGELLPFVEWRAISERVFGQLRGAHDTPTEAGAAASPGANHAGAAAAAPSAGDDGTASLSATGPKPPPSSSDGVAASRRRSQTRFGTPRTMSMGMGLPSQHPALDASPGGGGGGGGGGGSPAVGMSPSQFLRQIGAHSRRSASDAEGALAGGGYHASSRAVGASAAAPPVHPNSSGARARTSGLGQAQTSAAAAAAEAANAERKARDLQIVHRVKTRVMAQQKQLLSAPPTPASLAAQRAHALHAGDLDKLAASLASSVAHDTMVLREMLPSFHSMFAAVVESAAAAALAAEAKEAAGSCTMRDLASFLEKKLLLPVASCNSLMAVLELALRSCRNAAESRAQATLKPPSISTAGVSDPAAAAADAPLPPSAFAAEGRLGRDAFTALLSKSLHLQSQPFSHFLDPELNFLASARAVCSQVFLGGSCNPTTWRTDEAIPILSQAGLSFFNPQVDNWAQELVLIESLIKQNCETLLFVIDSETRAIASMIEAAEFICSGRDVVLVVKNLADGAQVNKEPLGPQQIRDLNRARSYVTDVAQRHGLDVFTDIKLACEYIVTKIRDKQHKEEQYAAEVECFIASEEFCEKTFEEFFRCDTAHRGRLNSTQLLLACLHLEQDLRPLIPPQAAKHRQPQLSDVDVILNKFGAKTNGAAPIDLDCDQFLQFSRMLFRNVCAHVKL